MRINAYAAHPLVRLVLTMRRAVAATVVGGLMAVMAVAGPTPAPAMVPVAEPFDPEVILPLRVDAALHRTLAAVERGVAGVVDHRRRAARRALRAAAAGFDASQLAVMHQVTAITDPEAEEESTAGPDSAQASLNVSQVSVGMLSSLFDGVRGPGMVQRITNALTTDQTRREELLTAITAMDPEGAGAPYVELLVDAAPQYTDEVSAIQEALADDRLSDAARAALRAALQRSQRAEAMVLAIVGPPED